MRRNVGIAIVLALLLALPEPGASASAVYGTVSPGNQAYTIAADWNQTALKLTGTETISFTNTRPQTISTVHLRLWPNGQTSCSKPFVAVSNVTGGTAGPLGVHCTDLPVTLDAPLASGQSTQISFSFSDSVPKNWNFRYGVSGNAVMLGNVFPILALTDDLGLHLEPYTINGESMYSSIASWHVTLDLPAALRVATTGTVSSHSTQPNGGQQLVIDAPNERDFAMAIGRFTVSTTTTHGITIRYFKQSSNGTSAAKVLAWAREAVDSFTQHYGTYDQPEIDLAEGTWHANGFEFPSMLMVDGSRDVVYHEIAHLWWFSMVGDNQWLSPWTDESFAEFSDRRLKGTNTNCNVSDPFANAGGFMPLNSTMGTFDAQGHYVGTIYVGGPCVLEKLRQDWGNARFDTFMSGLVTDFRGGIEGTCDVIDAMDAAKPPGYDMSAFLSAARLSTAGC